MLQASPQPKWVIAFVVVVLLAALFIRLGFWQLDRLEERRTENAVGESRLDAETVSLDQLLEETGDDLGSIEYRRVVASGRFDPEHEVLIRSQVHLGQAGFHVITPLVTADGAVLVNRGWVPMALDEAPVTQASPPTGDVEIEGWVHLTQTRPALRREDPPGAQPIFNRVDVGRIAQQLPYQVAPVYLVEVGERDDDLPVVISLPDFSSEGPHLAYAIQWFAFAAIGLVGFYFLLRRKAQSS
ncbi:MAG: SURF1 family cytochrome oxidase biogenesis protein [Acidimicrobiia bacterium]